MIEGRWDLRPRCRDCGEPFDPPLRTAGRLRLRVAGRCNDCLGALLRERMEASASVGLWQLMPPSRPPPPPLTAAENARLARTSDYHAALKGATG